MTGSHNDHLQLDCQLWRCICIGRIEKRKLFHFPFSFLFTYRLYFNVLLLHISIKDFRVSLKFSHVKLQ